MILLEILSNGVVLSFIGAVMLLLIGICAWLINRMRGLITYIWEQHKESDEEKKLAQLEFNEEIQKEIRKVGATLSKKLTTYDKRIVKLESDVKQLKKDI